MFIDSWAYQLRRVDSNLWVRSVKLLTPLIISCVATIASNPSAAAPKREAKRASAPAQVSMSDQLLKLAKEGVREKMKDPESANFRNLAIHTGSESPMPGRFYVCGEVNSKNAYGGYAGFTQFFSMIFWYEKVGGGIVGFTAIWDDHVASVKMAEFFASKCVN
jgi:hypothetical protein